MAQRPAGTRSACGDARVREQAGVKGRWPEPVDRRRFERRIVAKILALPAAMRRLVVNRLVDE